MRGDLEWRSIPNLARIRADSHAHDTAVVDGTRSVTFGELADLMCAATAAMLGSGIQRGDRVGIWAPNSLDWIVAALGAMGAGASIVPVNTRFKGDEAAYVLGRSGASLLFTVNGFLGIDYPAVLRASGAALPELRGIVTLDDSPGEDVTAWTDHLGRGTDVARHRALASIDAVRGDDIADILFTSGTTGRPKGAMTSHAQDLRAFADYTNAIGLRAGDRYLIVNPFFHSFGYKAGWLGCLMRAATAYPQPVLDLDTALDIIQAERITVLPGPPTLLQGILDHPSRSAHDLSSLRLTVTGAAAIPLELIRRLRDEQLFDVVLTGYGLTETSGLVSVSAPDDPPETLAAWSGRVADGIEVRVVDDHGRDVAPGEPGELLVRGYNVTLGYFADPEETARAIDADGWLRTGDIGVVDERAYVRVTDRKKDMYIVGGFNAYPAEIEDLLLGCKDIAQVAVVGAPDARLGEVGVAFVVPRRDAQPTPADIIAFARAHLANFKVPRHVELVERLPVNASGKVVKYELRARAAHLVTNSAAVGHRDA